MGTSKFHRTLQSHGSKSWLYPPLYIYKQKGLILLTGVGYMYPKMSMSSILCKLGQSTLYFFLKYTFKSY